MLFRKMSDEQESRLLVVVGLAVVTVVSAVAALLVVNPFAARPTDVINVVIESPYVGEGVKPGTALMVHGVKVGEVRHVTTLPTGGIRLLSDLQTGPTAGLTDTMGVDFRPANYFGVTGINVRPGRGGHPLTDGTLISVTPAGNFTLQAMLQRLGEISHGVLTPQLIDVIERTTTYLDGLDPMLETVLVVAETFSRIQEVSTEQLMVNTAGISAAFPGFVNASISTGDYFLHAALDGATEDFYQNTFKPTIKLAATDLFGAAGSLVGSHSTDLAPLTGMLQILTDIAPGVVPPDAIADTAIAYRERLQRLFGGPPDRRAVNVRVVLDSLPGVAAPLDAMGVIPPPPGEAVAAAPSAVPSDAVPLPITGGNP